jgi:hypothetical protein
VEYPHAFSQRGLGYKQIAELVGYIRTFAAASKTNKPVDTLIKQLENRW